MSALDASTIPSKDALTVIQWSERIGRNRGYTSQWVKDGLARGWMERASTEVEEVTGRTKRVVGYKLVAKAKR